MIYDVNQNRVIATAEFPSDVTRLIPFLKFGRMITGHANGDLRLLDVSSGQSVILAKVHNNHAVDHIQMDADRRILLTTTGKRHDHGQENDHQVAVWSLSENLLTRPFHQLSSSTEQGARRRQDGRQKIADESETSRDERG